MERIAVIDYGMGNLRSVLKALEHVAAAGQTVKVTGDAAEVAMADRVVFPGQGAMRDCMAELDRRGLREVIGKALEARPFLGICMGLQALLSYSEEDPGTRALDVISGKVRRFQNAPEDTHGVRLKVPHMGWNNIHQRLAHPLWQDIAEGERFYFVHSYYVEPEDERVVAATCTYGVEFACALSRGKLFAVQFHPEKSQRAGLALLRNFLSWSPA